MSRLIDGQCDACYLKETNGWISVKDRLPKLEESVLVYGVGRTDGCRNKHTIEISYRYLYRSHWQLPGEEVWAEPWDYFFVNYKITHWMPLPKPPKEEKEDA